MNDTHTDADNTYTFNKCYGSTCFFFALLFMIFLVRFWREYAHTRKEEEVERKSMISERDEMSM